LTRVKESGSFFTRVKEAGVPGSFFTRALDAPSPGSFCGRRRRVGANGGDPMTPPPPPRRVLDVDEDDREDDDTRASILRGSQCYRCGIVNRGWLPAAMWSRTAGRVRPSTPHHTFLAAAFLLGGKGPLPS
jgi:hypothetical protein